MDLFKELFEISTSEERLDSYLKNNMLSIQDFYNSNYRRTAPDKEAIERFILLKSSIISQLDYSQSYNKAFISILLDFSERFNFISSVPKIVSILQTNQVVIGNRLQSALLFLQNIDENARFVERFDVICKKLQLAIDTEEDYEVRTIATFLNYYGIVINDTHNIFVKDLQQKINGSINSDLYPFLSHPAISEALLIETENKDSAYIQIQQLIDRLLLTETTQNVDFIEHGDILIEQDSDYSVDLNEVAGNFDSIRRISVGKTNGRNLTNRGVKILESEDELFTYMQRFGNMHKAKLLDAFKNIDTSSLFEVRLIDWGCGQGFASMLFLEKYSDINVKEVILIEPSELAIKRASLHVRKYNPNLPTKTICKKIDKVEEKDISQANVTITTIHLFSNILDIDDYSQERLIRLIESSQKGMNYFICISPYIDDIKTERLNSFNRYFETKYSSNFEQLYKISTAKNLEDVFWLCNNNKDGKQELHGLSQYCRNNYTIMGGCANKWTRVTTAFSIDIE